MAAPELAADDYRSFNALAETVDGILKTELIDRSDWASSAEAKAAVFEYIEVFYNRIRRHSSLGNRSPEQFEERYRSKSGRQGRVTHHCLRNRGNSMTGRTGRRRPVSEYDVVGRHVDVSHPERARDLAR